MSAAWPVLVTGGVRSGKSRHAEQLLQPPHVPDGTAVTYLAAGPQHDDADWADRVRRHRERRPAVWRTAVTLDVTEVLTSTAVTGGAVLVDCLGTWLTGVIDRAQAWEETAERVQALVEAELVGVLDALGEARHGRRPVVLVTNEVGLGVVPDHRSGRLFRDLLGTVNQQVAAACAEVHLVIAGRVLRL